MQIDPPQRFRTKQLLSPSGKGWKMEKLMCWDGTDVVPINISASRNTQKVDMSSVHVGGGHYSLSFLVWSHCKYTILMRVLILTIVALLYMSSERSSGSDACSCKTGNISENSWLWHKIATSQKAGLLWCSTISMILMSNNSSWRS